MNYLITNLKEEIYLIEIFFALYPYQKLLFIIIYLFLPSFASHYEFKNLNYLYHFFTFKFELRVIQFVSQIIISFQDFLFLSKMLFPFRTQA